MNNSTTSLRGLVSSSKLMAITAITLMAAIICIGSSASANPTMLGFYEKKVMESSRAADAIAFEWEEYLRRVEANGEAANVDTVKAFGDRWEKANNVTRQHHAEIAKIKSQMRKAGSKFRVVAPVALAVTAGGGAALGSSDAMASDTRISVGKGEGAAPAPIRLEGVNAGNVSDIAAEASSSESQRPARQASRTVR